MIRDRTGDHDLAANASRGTRRSTCGPLMVLAGIALAAAACGRGAAPVPAAAASLPPEAEQVSTAGSVAASFRHVNLHVQDGIVLEIRRLDGILISTTPGAIASFDDPRSYSVRVDSAEVGISPRSLSNLMNQRVFAYKGAPLKNVEVSMEAGRLKEKGTMRKGVDVPFSMLADVSLTADGRIRLHPVSMKVLGIETRGLMKFLGIDLRGMIALRESSGIEIQGDDFLMASDRMMPLPKFAGRLTGVRIEGTRLIEQFGPPPAAAAAGPSDRTARSFLSFRGGTLRFGRLTMADTDLEIVGETPDGILEFSVPNQTGQLVAGYSKTRANGGLTVYVPNYGTTALAYPPGPRKP